MLLSVGEVNKDIRRSSEVLVLFLCATFGGAAGQEARLIASRIIDVCLVAESAAHGR